MQVLLVVIRLSDVLCGYCRTSTIVVGARVRSTGKPIHKLLHGSRFWSLRVRVSWLGDEVPDIRSKVRQ